MGSSEPGTNSGGLVVPGDLSTTPQHPPVGRPRLRHRHVWAIALTAGVAAGLFSWLGAELGRQAFRPRLFKVEILGRIVNQPSEESQVAADLKNATLGFAILGGLTGLAMGLAGGLAVHSPARGVIVALTALAAGALVGGLACLALLPLFYRRHVPDVNDLLTPILIHGGIWMAIGGVGGLAFAIGMRSGRHRLDAVGAACVGGFLASILFHLLCASFYPDLSSMEPVAGTSVLRLFAMILVTVLVAAGSAMGALGRDTFPASFA